MKVKFFITLSMCLFLSGHTEAQFFKKLKKKAEEAAERTVINRTDEEVTKGTNKGIDVVTGKGSNDPSTSNGQPISYENPSKEINTDAKRAFYTTDVIVDTYDDEKQSYTTSYFDSDELAMKMSWTDQNTGSPSEAFNDSEGYFISYNQNEGHYEKSNILSMGAMSMMAPTMIINAYKLPVDRFLEITEEFNDKGLKVNAFIMVEFAFMYSPEDFRNGDYTEAIVPCRGSADCTKFSIVSEGYEGSYILFDSDDRLAEININMKDNPNFGTNEGYIKYTYKNCEVNLPSAVEKKMFGQDLIEMGLDPNKN
ncbi:hypothetical protein [Allomuricauda sp. NBRC 101325]|uniref:hypothetical protein n=1 Tax=Allomuricauda sp. NBRC 101325 TaxID=1113758 RepID=UPI0024A19F12|nr:hypothetical protein [Muricauda sp. NBRC 101325]GLU43769.1 hypothetical protein Musp01_13930 [Muricauda sp. NBRC 101325]